MLLLPYVYPTDATKTSEEACAQAMVARSPNGSNSKKPSDIVHDLELKTEYYLNRAELKTICSDVEGVLQHALPKKMKQLLAGFQFRQSISSHSGRTKVTDPTTKHPRGFQE
ncbi:hypothetical protein H0H93_001043 [Arthromyces matolae]|nr:hypothetical protein H0H93_001043 [Arthromyces matolae]